MRSLANGVVALDHERHEALIAEVADPGATSSLLRRLRPWTSA